jgi:hypothetical protein
MALASQRRKRRPLPVLPRRQRYNWASTVIQSGPANLKRIIFNGVPIHLNSELIDDYE